MTGYRIKSGMTGLSCLVAAVMKAEYEVIPNEDLIFLSQSSMVLPVCSLSASG
jgi:hypothetical protein